MLVRLAPWILPAWTGSRPNVFLSIAPLLPRCLLCPGTLPGRFPGDGQQLPALTPWLSPYAPSGSSTDSKQSFQPGQDRGGPRRDHTLSPQGHMGRAVMHPRSGPIARNAELDCQAKPGRITCLTLLLGGISYFSSCSDINYRGCP